MIMPNGRSIVLERQQGADAGGYSGLEDEVDNHWAELFKAALLSTVVPIGNLIRLAREAESRNASVL